ncbi:hypothetical protein MNBD_GAMMA12-2868 [hydrothermal vent metagenome]|uniref:Uncharacterized protein n=1 Tax=hydrothermal vent metagenome TaxID=652676 RepID=A0A3B0Z285_9ZZZZ
MKLLKIKRVYVEPSQCAAHTLCQSESPQGQIKIEYSTSEGYDVAVVHEYIVPRTKESLLILLHADDVCPMDAFRVELESGEVFLVSNPKIQKYINSKNVEWV